MRGSLVDLRNGGAPCATGKGNELDLIAGSKFLKHLKGSFRSFSIPAVLLSLAAASQVHGQTIGEAELAVSIRSAIKAQYGTQAQMDQAIERVFGVKLSPQKAAVARSDLQAVLAHPQLPAYLAQVVLPLSGAKISKEELAAATTEVMQQVQVKGIARLTADKQAMMVRHVIDMAKWAPAPLCKALFLGQLDSQKSAALERRFIASLPLGKFEAISALYRAASEAELNKYPDRRTLSASQAKITEQAQENSGARRLMARVAPDVIERVNQSAESAPAEEVCLVMTETTEAMLELPDPFRSWALTRFAQAMQ
jgi:hypothetical protein